MLPGNQIVWAQEFPADDIVYTAEDPQKADRLAAAPRTGGQSTEPDISGEYSSAHG
jgi:hypothetical protein